MCSASPACDDAVLAELLAGAVGADSFDAARAALRQFGRGSRPVTSDSARPPTPRHGRQERPERPGAADDAVLLLDYLPFRRPSGKRMVPSRIWPPLSPCLSWGEISADGDDIRQRLLR
jgi:hypothetical protein